MGIETFICFQREPLDPRPYAPEVFLGQLNTDPPSLECVVRAAPGSSDSAPRVFEYRVSGQTGWPAVVVTIVSEGLLVCEYDRRIAVQLFGPLVMFALDHAHEERVVVESA